MILFQNRIPHFTFWKTSFRQVGNEVLVQNVAKKLRPNFIWTFFGAKKWLPNCIWSLFLGQKSVKNVSKFHLSIFWRWEWPKKSGHSENLTFLGPKWPKKWGHFGVTFWGPPKPVPGGENGGSSIFPLGTGFGGQKVLQTGKRVKKVTFFNFFPQTHSVF